MITKETGLMATLDYSCFEKQTIRLDGRALVRLEGLQGIHWRIIKKPDKSQAELRNPEALVATLRIDKPGLYEIQVNVDGLPEPQVIRITARERPKNTYYWKFFFFAMTGVWFILLTIKRINGDFWIYVFWIYTIGAFIPWLYGMSRCLSSPSTFVLPHSYKPINNEWLQSILKRSLSQRFLDLTPFEFEEFVSQMFKDAGYKATLTPKSGDFGADILLQKGDEKVVVQVKKYRPNHKVGVKEVAETIAAREYYQCQKAVVVTTSTFTSQAIQLAQRTGTELWDFEKLKHVLSLLYGSSEKTLSSKQPADPFSAPAVGPGSILPFTIALVGAVLLVVDLSSPPSGRIPRCPPREPGTYCILAKEDPAEVIAFSPDGHFLAAGHDEWIHGRGRIVVYETQYWKRVLSLVVEPLVQPGGAPVRGWTNITSIAFSPDGKRLAAGSCGKIERSLRKSGCTQGKISIWDVDTGKLVRTLVGHHGEVQAIAFHPSGMFLVSGAWDEDEMVKVWNTVTGRDLRTLKTRDYFGSYIESVVISPDGRLVAAGSLNGKIRVWDWYSGQELWNIIAHRSPDGYPESVTAVAFSPDGRFLASTGGDNALRVWKVSSVALRRHYAVGLGYEGGLRRSCCVTFHKNGEIIAAIFGDGTVRFLLVSTGKEIQALPASERANALAFHPNGQLLAVSYTSDEIRIWNVSNLDKLAGSNK